MEYAPYIVGGIALIIFIWQYIAIRRHMRTIDSLKVDYLEKAKENFKDKVELAQLKGADEVSKKSLDEQAAHINDLLKRL